MCLYKPVMKQLKKSLHSWRFPVLIKHVGAFDTHSSVSFKYWPTSKASLSEAVITQNHWSRPKQLLASSLKLHLEKNMGDSPRAKRFVWNDMVCRSVLNLFPSVLHVHGHEDIGWQQCNSEGVHLPTRGECGNGGKDWHSINESVKKNYIEKRTTSAPTHTHKCVLISWYLCCASFWIIMHWSNIVRATTSFTIFM